MQPSYIYKATLKRVVDGDTIIAIIDLGCHVLVEKRIRLAGIDCPALKEEAGQAAKAWVQANLPTSFVLKTYKDKTDKYARLLGDIVLNDGGLFNQSIIDAGHATAYKK
jgi:endonuclease YncB( thermonuclease family)